MFSILPDECLLLIIKEVIDRPNESNNLSKLIPNCFGIKKSQDYNHFHTLTSLEQVGGYF